MKINVLLLFGGESTEHEVSCLSCYSVLKNIDLEKFDVSVVGISKNGDWLVIDDSFEKEDIKTGNCFKKVQKGCGIAPALDTIKKADVVFPVMHGIMAEDGTIQGLLTILGKPFVGPGVLSSGICMDKVYTKIILENAGIPVAKAINVTREELRDFNIIKENVNKEIGYPCFVKPSNSGSSVGAYKVKNESELEEKVKAAAKYDSKVLIEEYIKGKEVECAVLGNEHPKASTPGEIVSTSEFYDYDDKYINGTSSTRIPADIPLEARDQIRKYACKAFLAVSGAGLSRVDFFYVPETGRIVLNEINTLPGFTEISMYSKMWAHDGLSFKDLVTELINLAFAEKDRNKRYF